MHFIINFNENSGDVEFSFNKMGILSIDINNIYLEIILMKMIVILLFLLDFWLGILNLKKRKALKRKISEELMPIAAF